MSRSVWNATSWNQVIAGPPLQGGVSGGWALTGTSEFGTQYLHPGEHILGHAYNGSEPQVWNIRASSENVPSYLVMRDTTGSFSAAHLTVSSLALHTHTVIASDGTIVSDDVQTQGGMHYLKRVDDSEQVQFDGTLTVQGMVKISGLDVLADSSVASFAQERLFVDGNMVVTGDITALSDRRIKRDVAPIDRALTKVLQMRGVTYTRTEDAHQTPCVGMLAQEVQDVFPEVVHETKDGMLGVSYGNLVAVLIEAVKELTAEVRALRTPS